MEDPHPVTVWTARACAAVWLISLAVAARSGREGSARRRWEMAWSIAALALLVHVLVAFHFEHSWSHAAAYRHTAKQTAATVGIDWGGGLYFNYLVLIVWLGDVLRLWNQRHVSSRPNTTRAIVDWFVAFLMINATVVFGPWGWKPVGALVAVGLVVAYRFRTSVAGDEV